MSSLSASPSPLSSALPSPSFLPRSPVINLNHPRKDFDFDSPYPASPGSHHSCTSSFHEDVLTPGDLIGPGLLLQREALRVVPMSPAAAPARDPRGAPAPELEVVRRLGTGSYAVVYLVREVLARRDPSDDGCIGGRMDVGDVDCTREYGRDYAVKCLSKANLDAPALAAQMAEATIHQSVPPHANIVTLHRTLETPSFLLLLLEFVPGEDLFYFLEQARDHYDPTPVSPASSLSSPISPVPDADVSHMSSVSSHTPPTPSLLSTLHPSQLLSHRRLKLIASMFSQMCEAVAACHNAGVFHRDIKPENFIVTDGWVDVPGIGGGSPRRERKVIVKLTDFGLSTTEVESADMDCGSAPYMSYECRNNCSPTYSPRAADVWSLGIVLINMLYHINPWTDTTQGRCTSFTQFRADPVHFFETHFAGMTPRVAEFFATRVFCLLGADDPLDTMGRRVGAHELGRWVRELPHLLSPEAEPQVQVRSQIQQQQQHKRGQSSSSLGFAISSVPRSRRPISRQASAASASPARASAGATPLPSTPALRGRPLSRAPSAGLAPLPDDEFEEDGEGDVEGEGVAEGEGETGSASRSTSVARKRKRGARKGRGAHAQQQQQQQPTQQPQQQQSAAVADTLTTLASASQSLARELSRASRSSQAHKLAAAAGSASASGTLPPVPASPSLHTQLYPQSHAQGPIPMAISGARDRSPAALFPAPAHVLPPTPTIASTSATRPAPITKKPSKWRLGFGKSSTDRAAAGEDRAQQQAVGVGAPDADAGVGADAGEHGASATARHVASVIMGLNAGAPHAATFPPRVAAQEFQTKERDVSEAWPRGRQGRPAGANTNGYGYPAHATIERWADNVSEQDGGGLPFGGVAERRNTSPTSTRASGRALASSASSIASASKSGNWRSSFSSSSAASTSAFTRYSNASVRSVSTVATSVSASSWRNPSSASLGSSGHKQQLPAQMPPSNIKFMTGVPWVLDEFPRHFQPPNAPDVFSRPPPLRKQRVRKPKDLPTISERPGQAPKSPLSQRQDASASSMDLRGAAKGRDSCSSTGSGNIGNGNGIGGVAADGESAEGAPRKVQKGQINALAKMLSALRL